MTQVVRQKWVLGLLGLNTALVLVAFVLIALSSMDARKDHEAAAATRDAELTGLRAELSGLRAEVEPLRSLRAAVDELKSAVQKHPEPRDTQLGQTLQTLQLLAGEQQLLLLRALQPAAPASAPKASARRARRRTARAGCPAPQPRS